LIQFVVSHEALGGGIQRSGSFNFGFACGRFFGFECRFGFCGHLGVVGSGVGLGTMTQKRRKRS